MLSPFPPTSSILCFTENLDTVNLVLREELAVYITSQGKKLWEEVRWCSTSSVRTD